MATGTAISTFKSTIPDSIPHNAKKCIQQAGAATVSNAKQTITRPFTGLAKKWRPDSNVINNGQPFKNLLTGKPLLRVNGGYIAYNLNYRSNIDTPFLEKSIAQHNTTGQVQLTVAGNWPINISFWSRQSNSVYFRDITDVQLGFDPARFRNMLREKLGQSFNAFLPKLDDSLTGKLYALKDGEYKQLGSWLHNPLHLQKLTECRELIDQPGLANDPALPDSTNQRVADSLQQQATAFLALYEARKVDYEHMKKTVDSLKLVYETTRRRIQQMKAMLENGQMDWGLLQKWKTRVQDTFAQRLPIPRQLSWLMGIRNFSLGRSALNYSELTAKNISVNGLNFEYNSWYYLAVTAGMLDYRFRDFVVNRADRAPQYFYMARIGLGRLEANYIILSAYRGQKQLYRSSGVNSQRPFSNMNVTGLSLEAKWQVHRNAYITAEFAESVAPDFRSNPPKQNNRFSLSDNTTQAWAVKLFAVIPRTATRLDAMYKYTGANFQSFSVFQSNAAVQAWHIKLEQYLLNRKLRMNAALRKNDFSNPFLAQPYRSNTVFKSLQATLRVPKWPTVSLGYIPMSQLSVAGSQVLENQYQVFNASLYHRYKLGFIRANSMLMVNRFYNTVADTALFYYNAVNILFSQSFYFKYYTATIGYSQVKNRDYQLNVMEESFTIPIKRIGSLGLGCKINNLDKQEVKVGMNINAGIYLAKWGTLGVQYEKGYLPGIGRSLVKNDMASVQFTKAF